MTHGKLSKLQVMSDSENSNKQNKTGVTGKVTGVFKGAANKIGLIMGINSENIDTWAMASHNPSFSGPDVNNHGQHFGTTGGMTQTSVNTWSMATLNP